MAHEQQTGKIPMRQDEPAERRFYDQAKDAQITKLREALRDIQMHVECTSPAFVKYSGVHRIATVALEAVPFQPLAELREQIRREAMEEAANAFRSIRYREPHAHFAELELRKMAQEKS